MAYVIELLEANETQVAVVGGKAAQLGELSRLDGVCVPDGFCVTTDAFERAIAQTPSVESRLDRLSRLPLQEEHEVGRLSEEIRQALQQVTIPDDVASAIRNALARLGNHLGSHVAVAVRSSATAEDLPTASFAGQQDSYLGVVGPAAVLEHIRRCWASLFTERAVTYRLRNGIDHRGVRMAVLVQQMVFPQAAGVLFTADPVTSNRTIVSVEATVGLGEALVSGMVSPDAYTVRGGEITARTVATKERALRASSTGGVEEEAVDPARRQLPALTDAQVLWLAELGRRIEAYRGRPQDIEWCLDDAFQIVQARPITTLFPIPNEADDENHVYVSVGHQQMMTDPFKPLGLSVWQLTAPRPMAEAGGRLFVDVTQALASPVSRPDILRMLGRSDPLIGDALATLVDRDDFLPPPPEADGGGAPPWVPPGQGHAAIDTDPRVVEELITASQDVITGLKREIAMKSGPALVEFVRSDLEERRQNVFDPRSLQVLMAGVEAAWWLNDRMHEWLGETNAADVLTQSVPNNVTSAMGLALLDVADAIRPYPDVVAFLRHVQAQGFDDTTFLDELARVSGGQNARDAVDAFLDAYGMRCVGEIDITRPRWIERPTALVPAILTNVRAFPPGAAKRRFDQGLRQAQEKERELLARLRALPDGEAKAGETQRMIDRVRTFAGYREYPKYALISRYFVYKQALLEEAERLVRAGVLQEAEDLFFITLPELQEIVSAHQVDAAIIQERKEVFTSYQALTPPRVLTSDGEMLTGSYRRDDVPTGALPGLPVSAGAVHGRARVITDLAGADLEPGDILVTAYTDPSWTSLFPVLTGLVTEVGGLMTHGAVIAREYGLPAVVGVQNATELIQDRQQIRVHGTHGYVELLGEPHRPTTPPAGDPPASHPPSPSVPSLNLG